MRSPLHVRILLAATVIAALAVTIGITGCQKFHQADTQPLYKSGMWSDTIQQLRDMNVTDSEVADLTRVHEAGLSDNGIIELMKIYRSRKQVFASGESVSGLLRAGVAESTVIELAHVDQIGTWALEAQGIRLGGYSDQVVLAVAHRRADRLPTVSAPSLLEIRNTGVTEEKVLTLIAGGLTDEQAGQIIAAHKQNQVPVGFVHRPKGQRSRHR
jgi:hypothetical protein